MQTRRHDIDALRAIAFAFLILYHLAMIYVAGWDFHVKSDYQANWLQWPMQFMNRWRMDLIFLISGMSSAMLWQKSAAGAKTDQAFFRSRSLRLLLPLLFGMAVIIPVQPYCQGVTNGLVEPGYGQFLLHYYSGYHWPARAFDGWQYGFTWNHLWYLAYLWDYTAVLLLARQLGRIPTLSNMALRWKSAFLGLRGWRLIAIPAASIYIVLATLCLAFPETHDLVNDWYAHGMYFMMFIFGWWLGNDGPIWQELLRLRKASALLALLAYAGYAGMGSQLSDMAPAWQLLAIWLLRALYVWTMLCAVLGWGHALLNRPFSWLGWANQAVYPWYILHQSLMILLAYWLIPLKLGGALEAGLVGAGTVLGCWLLTACIQRINWLRPCFGLKAGISKKRAAKKVEVLATHSY
jgi:peptidoglycan/LPS O-acetylase OafA/YrhL